MACVAIGAWGARNAAYLAASILVLPPGVDPLSRRIFGFIHYGVEDKLAGICLATVGMFWLLSALAILLICRRPGNCHWRGGRQR